MNTKTKKEKPQEILVYTDFTIAGNKAVEWGIYLAKKLRKNLLLLHVINENTSINDKDVYISTKTKLQNLSEKIISEHKLIVNIYYEEGCTCTIINSTAERRDAIFVIAAIHGLNDLQYLSGKALIKIASKARIPYLALQKNSPSPENEKPLLFPITMQREMKEKVGWATFFAFRLQEDIEIIVPKELSDLKNNLQFASKFFKSFDIDFQEKNSEKSQFRINKDSLKLAQTKQYLMLIALTSNRFSLLDRLIGSKESRLIANKQNLPILLISPRKDLYVPCL